MATPKLFIIHHSSFIVWTCSNFYSLLNSKISPGWQSSALQIAFKVENRIAFAFPFLSIERLARVKSTFEANSESPIFRFAIITSKFTIIAINYFFPFAVLKARNKMKN